METPTTTQPSTNPLDVAIQSILNSDQPDDIKAKQYSLAINRYRNTVEIQSTPKSDNDGEVVAEILESVPYQSRYKARRLLRILRENPEVEWNEKGELIFRQTPVPRSHMADLINYSLKTTKNDTVEPIGAKEFSKALASSHVSREFVPNYKSWKYVREAQTPVKGPTSEWSSESSTKRTKRTKKRQKPPPIKLDYWEEY